jgi:hypothetical protein
MSCTGVLVANRYVSASPALLSPVRTALNFSKIFLEHNDISDKCAPFIRSRRRVPPDCLDFLHSYQVLRRDSLKATAICTWMR